MKRELEFILSEEDKQYIYDTKLDMMELELNNDNLFGDDNKYKVAKSFNDLDDWEKNLIILYSKYKSSIKISNMLNVQKTTVNTCIRSIKQKLKLYYKI